jgi:predicted permease
MPEPHPPEEPETLRPALRGEVRARLAPLRLSPAREAEIVEELSQHLHDQWREHLAAGASSDAAARQTLAEFRRGNLLAKYMAPLRQSRAQAPCVPGAPARHAFGGTWQDLRQAARVFVQQSGFAVAAILTLALGIGATTAIFSVVHGVLLTPLPYAESDRLVNILHRMASGGTRNHGPDTYLTYRDHQRAFERLGASDRAEVSVTAPGDPEQVEALEVTSTYLPVLRLRPALGRFFAAEDDVPGAPLRVILTDGYWRRRFGGAEAAIGQTLRIDGRSAEIIGVLPPGAIFPRRTPELLLPMPLVAQNGIGFDFEVIGRLKPGVSLAEANADVGRMISLLHPSFAKLELQPNVHPLADFVVGRIGGTLWTLFAAVGVVLLIAAANVANLYLVRFEARQAELAMRAALGANRARLARVLLSESAWLALGGGALGLALAYAGVALLRVLAPPDLPRVGDIRVDGPVLVFTLGISLAVAIVLSLLPIAKVSHLNIAALKESGRTGESPGRHRTRNLLVVGEIALAVVLLVVAGLMVRTVVGMLRVPPGFTDPHQVQTFRLSLPQTVVVDDITFARRLAAIMQQLERIPGVASVGASSSVTMDGEDNGNSLQLEEFPVPEGELSPLWRFKSLTPGYVETMGNRVAAGRTLTWTDVYERRPVLLISEALAREYWQEPSRAIGKRVRYGPDLPWREVIGVVGDERDDGLDREATKIVYWPLLNDSYPQRTVSVVVRSSRVGTTGFMREVSQAVWSVDASLPLSAVATLDEIRDASMAWQSFVTVLLGVAAAVALVLSVVGIYAVIAYVARQRTREIAVRMALGAHAADVRRLFLRQGVRLTAAGLVIGLAAAALAGRLLSTLLFGVQPVDLITFAIVSVVLGAVALAAAYLPARRAARVDPAGALR